MTTPAGSEPTAFVGRWRIARELSDLRTGRCGRFTGTLVVAAEAGGYGWEESGTLVWGEHTGPAQRRLCLRLRGGSWWVCFADGRPFHPWRVGIEVVHPCAADVYRGTLSRDPHDADRFELVWVVSGPTKQQRIVSRMTRVE